jgi:VanZ family protein
VRAPSLIRLAIGGSLLALYMLAVLGATMWPTPLDTNYESTIAHVLDLLHRHGLPGWFGYARLEFTANILMFIPLGFLVALTLPRRSWWLALLMVPAFSFGIEMVQGAFLAARFASGWDVLANTIGGCLGAALSFAVRALVHARDRLIVTESLAGRTDRAPESAR